MVDSLNNKTVYHKEGHIFMGQKRKITVEEKLKTIQTIHAGLDSINNQARLLGVVNNTVHIWIHNYAALGIDGIKPTSKKTKYSKCVKESAVLDYLSGVGSLINTCQKHGIRSTRQLRQWIMKYNSHEELKVSGTGGTPIMTKGRTTTYKERIEIIQYCIEHENNYAETAKQYQVSYQQVYTWIKKYESTGVEGLLDLRGRKKPESEMSESEKLRVENKLLKSENKRQEMEITFLKKLDEIERRRF